VKPNISLRSPVSTVLIVIVTTPPFCAEPAAPCACPPPAPTVSPSSVAKELMMYLRALSLI
jgi:hypothetical protein